MKITEKLKIIGSLCATSGMIVMYFIFMSAYATESKSTCININNYKEANFEVIMIQFQLILSIIGTACLILFRDRKKSKSNEIDIPTRGLASV
jgi:hypothetical protein